MCFAHGGKGRPQAAPRSVDKRENPALARELVARAIHYASPRKGEALYFGQLHGPQSRRSRKRAFWTREGSFTGAVKLCAAARFGIKANGGTLFLDEIGELTPDLHRSSFARAAGAAHRTRGLKRGNRGRYIRLWRPATRIRRNGRAGAVSGRSFITASMLSRSPAAAS